MKKLLAVVDYQNDFVNGVLGFKGAEAFLPRIINLVNEYSKNGDIVVFTKDIHNENYLHTEEGRHLPVPHCLAGSKGANLVAPLEEMASSHEVFVKDGDTFGCRPFYDYLLKHRDDIDYITLVGLDLSICVLSNAVLAKTACPNAHIMVDLSASGDEDPAISDYAIKELRRLQIETEDFTIKKGII
jgi:nicotinamidase/pyrazinamidase